MYAIANAEKFFSKFLCYASVISPYHMLWGYVPLHSLGKKIANTSAYLLILYTPRAISMHFPSQHEVVVIDMTTIILNEDSLPNHNKEHLQEAQFTSQAASAGPWVLRPEQVNVGKAETEEKKKRVCKPQSSIHFLIKNPKRKLKILK